MGKKTTGLSPAKRRPEDAEKKAMATSATAGKKKNEDIDTREDLTAVKKINLRT